MTTFRGIKKLLSSVLAILLSLVMVVGAFPAGALTITPEMLTGIKDFVDDYIDDGKLDHDMIEQFLKDHIVDMEGADAYDDPDSALNELEAELPKKANGEPDYGHIVECFKKDKNEPIEDTFETVITVVSKLQTVQELIDFITGRDELDGAQNKQYFTVEWYIEGSSTPVLIQNDFYLKHDVFTYPELTLASGEYVVWHNPALFEGQYEADGVTPAVTKIYGTLHTIAKDFVDITNGISQVSDVYKATLSDDGSTVVIAVDAQKADYVELLTGFREENSKSSLKDDAIQILTDTISAVLHAGINDFSINGHHLLRVDSYDIPDLIDILVDKEYADLVDIGGIIDLIRAEDKSFARFANMPEYDDGDATTDLHKVGEYTLTMATDGAASTSVKVVLTLDGDVSTLEDIADTLSDIVDFKRNGSTLMLDLNFSSANIQAVLKRAYRNTNIPESIRNHIEKIEHTNEFGNPEDYYVISGEMTVGELKDLIINGDYDLIGDKVGIDNLTSRDKFQKVLDKVMSYVPDRYDNTSYFDIYDGEGNFRFDQTITKDSVRAKIEQYLSGKQITLLGKTISTDTIINKVFNRIDYQSVTLDGNIHVGEYRELILRDKNNPEIEFIFFAQPGIKLDLFADMLGLSTEGYNMTYTCEGVEVTETPDTDSVILYSSSARVHTVTYTVTLTDKGVTYNTITFSDEISYGASVNALVSMEARAEGHTLVANTLVGVPADGKMPDSDIAISATFDLNYYTILWVQGNTVLETDEVPYGTIPEYNGETPTLPSGDALTVWEFSGWDSAIVAATADATYTAQFADDDRFGAAIDPNVTETYTFDGNTLSIDVTSNVVGLNGSYHSLEELVSLLNDFDTAPNIEIHKNYDGSGIKLFFDHDALEAIAAAFGGDLEGATYSTQIDVVEAGRPYAGRTRVRVTFADKSGNAVPITGLKGAPLEVPYTERDEFYPVVLYHNEAQDTYDKVDSELVNGMLQIKTTHFSTFIIDEAPVMYAVNIGATVNGTVAADVTTAAMGDTVNVTVTPDHHYELSRLYYVNKGTEYDVTGTSFTMPSGDVTIYATFTKIRYNVTFEFDNGDAPVVIQVNSGETLPESMWPADPTKAQNAQYTYTFSHWEANPDVDVSVEAVESNVTYTAIYNRTTRQYTVTFKYGDGVTETQQVLYGATATAPQDTSKTSTVQYDYTFTGWTSDTGIDITDAITGNVTFTAEYSETVRKYTVKFVDDDGTTDIIPPQQIAYGSYATVPADPTKAPTEQYEYSFSGWLSDNGSSETDAITGDVTFTAQYTATPIVTDTESSTPDDTESSTPDDTESSTPDDTESSTPEDTESSTPEDTESSTPEDTESSTPEDTESSTPEDTESSTPEDTESSTPEDTESSTPADTESSTPADTESSTPADTESETPGVIGSDTQPGTTEDTETETDAGDKKLSGGIIALIIILIILLILILLIVIGYLLYIKGILPVFFLWLLLDRLFGRNKEEPVEESTEEEAPEEAPQNLFVPIGQEVPEEEEVVVHVEEVSVEEVDEMMTDTTAEHILTVSDKVGGAGKLGIINVGTLSGAFQSDDLVNLEILKEKGMIENSTGRLKVLASGSINKPLRVEADAFSLQAIKMITLTGGQAIKLKSGNGAKKD